jgi:hypothetical protein
MMAALSCLLQPSPLHQRRLGNLPHTSRALQRLWQHVVQVTTTSTGRLASSHSSGSSASSEQDSQPSSWNWASRAVAGAMATMMGMLVLLQVGSRIGVVVVG